MKTDVQHADGSTIVTVTGSVDALTAADLAEAISHQVTDGHVNIVVDLIGVEFMSSAGLRALLGAVKESRSHGGDLRLASANPGIDKVLKMSGFHTIAKVFATRAEAVASFGPQA